MGKQPGKDRTPGGGKDTYETDPEFYKIVDYEFYFGLDCSANEKNAKCSVYITKEQNAILVDWLKLFWAKCPPNSSIWNNPPYGHGLIQEFLRKSWQISQKGQTAVLLVHTCTDTKYWNDWVWDKAAEVRHIKGRLPFWSDVPDKYGRLGNTSDLPHSLIVYRPNYLGRTYQSTWDWKADYMCRFNAIPVRNRKTREIMHYLTSDNIKIKPEDWPHD